jgi:guanylate kinase
MRIAKAEQELSLADCFDRIIINDDLNKAKEKTLNIVSVFLNREKQ